MSDDFQAVEDAFRRAVERGQADVIVVYKIDRLSRSLMDFAKLVEVFDGHAVTFVSINGTCSHARAPT